MKKIIRGQNILTLSMGNKKLVGDYENAFMIWNLEAIKTCPYRTEMCEKSCYAMKSQRIYPSVRKSRIANFEDCQQPTFIDDMENTINYYLKKKDVKGKKVWFRIHESGDFWSKNYVMSWVEIAKKFPNITFMAYTKSIKFIKEVAHLIPSNLVIRFSIWDDTKQCDIEQARSLNLPIYTAFVPSILDEKIETENFIKCDCDCSKCKKCYSNDNDKIAVAIH